MSKVSGSNILLDFNPGLDIFVASRDRPSETLRAIEAIKRIDFGVKTRIIVSDNASSKSTVLVGLPADVVHLVRNPCTAIQHFNLIISEFNSTWILVTHDDDELLPHLGELFKEAVANPEINVVSGKSELVNPAGEVFVDPNYEDRLSRAGLVLHSRSKLIQNFDELLFDFGTLFPASAIIVKTSTFPESLTVNLDTNYAGDFEFSLVLARDSTVLFSGVIPVMRYHLHGGNSVFNAELPFILPAETLMCRISYALGKPMLISDYRIHRLKTDFLRSILLAYELGNFDKINTLVIYVREFERKFGCKLQTPITRLLIKSRTFAFLPRFFLRLRRRYLVHYENLGV
jgi:hypothetical protein